MRDELIVEGGIEDRELIEKIPNFIKVWEYRKEHLEKAFADEWGKLEYRNIIVRFRLRGAQKRDEAIKHCLATLFQHLASITRCVDLSIMDHNHANTAVKELLPFIKHTLRNYLDEEIHGGDTGDTY